MELCSLILISPRNLGHELLYFSVPEFSYQEKEMITVVSETCIYLFKNYLFIFLERQRDRIRDLPASGSLFKYLQLLELDQAEASTL